MNPNKERLAQFIDQNLESSISELIRCMNINSFSSDAAGVNAVQDIFAEKLTALGFKVERQKSKRFGDHLLADNLVDGPKTLLVGHADTAQAPNPNFNSAVREQDRLIGPGGYDMKAGVFMAFQALAALAEQKLLQQIPLRFLIIGDEEIGMQDSLSLHHQAANGSKHALVLEMGRPENGVVVARKGLRVCEIRSKGIKGHSGNDYWKCKNAIVDLAKILVSLTALSNQEKNLTVNVGTITGGDSPTVVPDSAAARFDIRYTSQKAADECWSDIQKIVEQAKAEGAELELITEDNLTPMEVLPGALELAERYVAECAELGEPAKIFPLVGGASSGNLLTAVGLPTIDALGPFGDGAHSNSEWFSINSFRTKSLALARFLVRDC